MGKETVQGDQTALYVRARIQTLVWFQIMCHDHYSVMPLHPVGVNSLVQCNVHGHLQTLSGVWYRKILQLSEMMEEKKSYKKYLYGIHSHQHVFIKKRLIIKF